MPYSLQELRLLRLLKAVQQSEMNYVELDFEEKTASTFQLPEASNRPPRSASLSPLFPSLMPTLDALEKHDCIRLVKPNSYCIIQLTHTGWHLSQLLLWKFLCFLGKSVLVPIVVSIITTIITLRFFR